MNPALLFRILAITAFSSLLAPAIAFVGMTAIFSVMERVVVLLQWAELFGLYLEAGPTVLLASALFAALVSLRSYSTLPIARTSVVALGGLAFAVVYLIPALVRLIFFEHVSNVVLLIAGMGVMAGAAVGTLLPTSLLNAMCRSEEA